MCRFNDGREHAAKQLPTIKNTDELVVLIYDGQLFEIRLSESLDCVAFGLGRTQCLLVSNKSREIIDTFILDSFNNRTIPFSGSWDAPNARRF
jgi:hypothetical protein